MNINKAISLKGYCNIDLCWKYISDISQQLTDSSDGKYCKIALQDVAIEGSLFRIETIDSVDEASSVWLLAASAVELINGSPIFNGRGEKAQQADTPLPLLTQDESGHLNALLMRCLCYDRAKRPSMNEISQIALNELKSLPATKRGKRVAMAMMDPVAPNEIDRTWPERMVAGVRKMVICIILALMCGLTSYGQTILTINDESNAQQLLKAVLLLRNKSDSNIDKAQDILAGKIKEFTLMDELRDKTNDCRVSGKNRFGVNVLVNELKRGRRVQSGDKDLLDGTDTRFAYSLIEKGVKKQSVATYTLTHREGQQCFIIVPYSASQKYSTVLKIGSKEVKPTAKDETGATYYFVSRSDGPDSGQTISLVIDNSKSPTDASFVVINHNYRNK